MFQRGFKTWSEKIACEVRDELDLAQIDPLSPEALAEYLEVRLWTPADLAGLSTRASSILWAESDSWSAVTVTYNGLDAVVYNPGHAPSRRSSDIMHELAHLIAGHAPSTVILSQDGSVSLRSFNRQQEDEASWLSGCLLLPRPALVVIARSDLGVETACQKYGVSDDLLNYRLNVTGVRIQLRHGRRSRSAPTT